MLLRNGKQLFAGPSNHGLPHQAPPSYLLDLPTEIRLMIYEHAIGYPSIQWTMIYDSKSGFVLALGDLHNADKRHNLHHRPSSLLQVCRVLYQEAFPILYDRIRFDIIFNTYVSQDQRLLESHLGPGYRLQLTSGRSQLIYGLAQVVLHRVKHVCVFMNNKRMVSYLWGMHILSTCLRHGMGLESLRFVSAGSMASLDNTWSTAEVLYFDSFKDTAVLEVLDYDVSEKDIAEFKRFQKCKNALKDHLHGC